MKRRMAKLVTACVLIAIANVCFAWHGHEVKVEGVEVVVEDIPTVTQRNRAVPVNVTLRNTGEAGISGTVAIRDMVDDSRVVGEAVKPFRAAPDGEARVKFAVSFGKGTYSALYPVHAYVTAKRNGRSVTAHAVRIVRTQFAEDDRRSTRPSPQPAVAAPDNGVLELWRVRVHRVMWRRYDGPPQYKDVGWTGQDQVSKATFRFDITARGSVKPCLTVQPPFRHIGGTLFCDYRLKLPDAKPLRLAFFNAIQTWGPKHIGTVFRVWVFRDDVSAKPDLLYDEFTKSETWTPGEADLSRYAGRTIVLRLESHPGPKKSSPTCRSYWGEPRIISGLQSRDAETRFSEAAANNARVGRRLLTGAEAPDGRTTFLLGAKRNRIAVVLAPGERGLLDGAMTLMGPTSHLSFHGFNIKIPGKLRMHDATEATRGYRTERDAGRVKHIHRLDIDGSPADLTFTFWPEGNGLRIAFACDERMADLGLGPADQIAPVVYFGHGYRIVNPTGSRVRFGGQQMSTSHVGCDFEKGMSLLQAVDVPPDSFEFDPETRRYALHTHYNGTLTLVAGERGAFDCAIRYRPLYDKKPAGGVARLAGRFCFDMWGALPFTWLTERMREMIRYGLTDAAVTVHCWQRWGYDYRFPDVWPPDPKRGTVEDLRRFGELCTGNGVLWGLHDNYRTFYPDATHFSYDHVAFDARGRPMKGWYNKLRGAQGYEWRPDHILPFVKRNLRLITNDARPTHGFIDALSAKLMFDYYDREGRFYPGTVTRAKWGEAFDTYREGLGGGPMTSEAGSDQLTGHLDGADCQFLTLTPRHGKHLIAVPCDDWARVPWFDAVNHHRFILHGVGYRARYAATWDYNRYALTSDDYISAEMLTGHALMACAYSFDRKAARKYWLAQDVARNLALRKIVDVEMHEDDMRRLVVTWDNGTRVYVNRSDTEWRVAGRVLPRYGYLAQGDGLVSAIEKRDGIACESCVGPGGWFCNARRYDLSGPIAVAPRIENFRHMGDGRCEFDMVWRVRQPRDPRIRTLNGLKAFVHFYRPKRRGVSIAFADYHTPPQPVTEWPNEVRYRRTVVAPKGVSGELLVGVGLFSRVEKPDLLGPFVPGRDRKTSWVGTLSIEREGERIVSVSFRPKRSADSSILLHQKTVGFGFAATNGAFRMQKTKDGLRLIPLPYEPAFDVTLRLSALDARGTVANIAARDRTDRRRGTPFRQTGDTVSFRHDGDAFCYEIAIR